MNKRKLLFSFIAAATLIVAGTISFKAINSHSKEKIESEEEHENGVKDEDEDKAGIDGAMEFYHRMKANYITGNIEMSELLEARKLALLMPSSKNTNFSWEEMGPDNVGGRVRALLVDNKNPNIMYAGGVAGGLWKSTTGGSSWIQVPLTGNMAISCITQTPSGDVYVGTGELGFIINGGAINYNTGSTGGGIYYKPANSDNFTILSGTEGWTSINRLASDKNGRVYAATKIGLKYTDDNGANWTQFKMGSFIDVDVAENTTSLVAISGPGVFTSTDGVTLNKKATLITTTGDTIKNIGRIEAAISKTNPNYIYLSVATSTGACNGIYRSKDFGNTWTQIAPGGSSSFDLFGSNNQGWYDNVLMVNKANPNIVYVGGIDLWQGQQIGTGDQFSWTKKSVWYADPSIPLYVHADQHVYAADPSNPNVFFQGTDGGISKTSDGGNTFKILNRNFNVTQFYAVSPHATGGVIGGAQDNGTQFITLKGNSPMQSKEIRGGDGGWSASSILNQDVIFTSIYNESIARSTDGGTTSQGPTDPATGDPNFYRQEMLTGSGKNATTEGAFVSSLAYWETVSYPNSIDSATFIADTTYAIGDSINVRSEFNNKYPFTYVLQQPLATGEKIRVQDPIQSRLFIPLKKGIFMTKQALYLQNKTPEWFYISNKTAGTEIFNIKLSHDGNVLYYVTTDGSTSKLYRITNLLAAQDSNTARFDSPGYVLTDELIKQFNGVLSSITIDPADPNRVAITIAGTVGDKVYFATDAATSANPTFVPKMGNLPATLPIYSSLIPMQHPNQLIIGTENGMFVTEDITAATPVWLSINNGLDPMVPVYFICQQQNSLPWKQVVTYDKGTPVYSTFPGVYNYGQIYIATHGRGFFTCKMYLSVPERNGVKVPQFSDLKIYPNPVVDNLNIEFNLNNNTSTIATIYSITGSKIKNYNLGQLSAGTQTSSMNVSELPYGTYILQIKAGDKVLTKKFIKN